MPTAAAPPAGSRSTAVPISSRGGYSAPPPIVVGQVSGADVAAAHPVSAPSDTCSCSACLCRARNASAPGGAAGPTWRSCRDAAAAAAAGCGKAGGAAPPTPSAERSCSCDSGGGGAQQLSSGATGTAGGPQHAGRDGDESLNGSAAALAVALVGSSWLSLARVSRGREVAAAA